LGPHFGLLRFRVFSSILFLGLPSRLLNLRVAGARELRTLTLIQLADLSRAYCEENVCLPLAC
jgi:hypothetical protein